MSQTRYLRFGAGALVMGLTLFTTVPRPASAQVPGIGTSAMALASTGLGLTVTLASTGLLADSWDALGASLDTGSIPVGTANVLEATAIGEGDLVSSAASLADLAWGSGAVSADFVMATATADSYGGLAGWSEVDGLVVNGVPIVPTGAANQTVVIGTIQVVLNEVTTTASGITVNALHITTLDGLINIVAGSATAVRP